MALEIENIPKSLQKRGLDKRIKEICERNDIVFMAIFGSFVRGEQKKTSDIDIAIEFDKHYDWDEDEFVIMRRKGGLNKEEKARAIRYCLHLATVNIFYQYWNLIQWLLLVYLHINTFWKDREAFTYCYESCYLSRKDLDPGEYKDCKNPDVFMLLSDPNYEIIYISEALERKLKPKNQQV